MEVSPHNTSPVQTVEQDIQDITTEKTQTVTPKRLSTTNNRKERR